MKQYRHTPTPHNVVTDESSGTIYKEAKEWSVTRVRVGRESKSRFKYKL